jgi:hypothetical protein
VRPERATEQAAQEVCQTPKTTTGAEAQLFSALYAALEGPLFHGNMIIPIHGNMIIPVHGNMLIPSFLPDSEVARYQSLRENTL